MVKEAKIGVIGLGSRGYGLLTTSIFDLYEDGLKVVAVCDLYEDRTQQAANAVEEKFGYRPYTSCNYNDIINLDEVDAVFIATAWESHVEVAVAAMKAGKYVGLEVGGAYSIEDCWSLVDTYEETGTPCMLMENCCYGKRETMILNMVRMGILGNIVHCSGAYCHDLRPEITGGKENRHYRLRNYINRNCENYPTHEIGPISKVLDINNGNRFISLVSMASSAKGLHDYVLDRKGEDSPLANVEFKQGDVVTTILKCINGQTVTIVLDTTLPRAYSRQFTVRGTKGAYFEDIDGIFLDHEHNKFEYNQRGIWDNAKDYEEKYIHPMWKDHVPRGGHDGMDGMEFEVFLDCVINRRRPPIDVYDAATYMAITALSEKSIACGGTIVDFPDFTRGKWYQRKDIEDWKFNLDCIKEDLY